MGKTTKLLSNNINGYLFENGKKKYYRLRGNEFARYADNEVKNFENKNERNWIFWVHFVNLV